MQSLREAAAIAAVSTLSATVVGVFMAFLVMATAGQ